MTQEDMPNIREIMDKSFEAGYKDAMDFAIDWLKRNANKYAYNTGGWYEYPRVSRKCWVDLKQKMEERLCTGI